ncbi:unnamed protein product [Gadus morhua 'NCC']
MTTLRPSPKAPCCQTTYCLYAAYLNYLLASPGSAASSSAQTSFQIRLAKRRTPSSKMNKSMCGSKDIQFSGVCPQHFLSVSVGISLQWLQTHQVGCSGVGKGVLS